MSDVLTTLPAVKEYLGITVSTYDTLIEGFIHRATDMIENYCSRHFRAADYTEYHDGRGLAELYPNEYPVNSVSHIYDDPDWVWGTDTEVDSDDYRIRDNAVIVLKSGTFSDDVQNIKLEYNAGYSTIPEDLAQACIEQCAWMFRQSAEGASLLGVTAKSHADGSVSYTAQDLLPQVRRVLEKYRKRHLA